MDVYYLGTKATPTFSTVRVLRARDSLLISSISFFLSFFLACLILFIQHYWVLIVQRLVSGTWVCLRHMCACMDGWMYMDAPG